MKNVKVLDCTLRDGGRIINCSFPNSEIREISSKLAEAKIDIVEVGFLRDRRTVDFNGNSTFFTDVEQISQYIDKNNNATTLFVAFIDYGLYDLNDLKPHDGKSVDGIRFGFTKKDYIERYDDVFNCAKIIKEKGYKLFIQGVNSLNYSDREILELIDMINIIQPYSFGIVDTYGAMYIDDVDRLYGLIDRNMNSDICINFHSHNNYQLSFGFAQEVIKLSHGTPRSIIIDATLLGMGKVAGNLNTELIIDYLIRKLHYDYEFETILDIIDDYIYKYAQQNKWGYSIPAMMAGVYKAHPNNIIYLTEKFRLETKDINHLLAMIPPEKRQRYDYENIERIYTEYIAEKVNDERAIKLLRQQIMGQEVFVMVPGNTLNTYKEIITNYIIEHDVMIISVNFVADDPKAWAFFGNQKRYSMFHAKRKDRVVITPSNIRTDSDRDIIVNYYSLINRGYKFFENSTIMLLHLLKKLNPCKITVAGFDGFDSTLDMNYVDASYQNDRHASDFEQLNKEISIMLREIVETMDKCEISFITPSIYEIV